MRIHTRKLAIATGVALATALLAPTAPALAASQGHMDATGMAVDLGPSPVGLPSNCPFPNSDANFVFVSGNAQAHDTTNNNGDWGGETVEGVAVFYEDSTPLYQGHLTIWGGGGNNARGQNEGGQTLNFDGSGAGGTLSIHVNFHGTTNASGTPTANVINVEVSCT